MVQHRVFYSFHYVPDSWRASQVRKIGAIEGNQPAYDNDWEQVKRGGDPAIKRWISKQMERRSCTVVLVGSNTANRKWINYEIDKSWKDKMGVAGIYIHGLKDNYRNTASKGKDPFNYITIGNRKLSSFSGIECWDPPGLTSNDKYSWIKEHLAAIIEIAINTRKKYP